MLVLQSGTGKSEVQVLAGIEAGTIALEFNNAA